MSVESKLDKINFCPVIRGTINKRYMFHDKSVPFFLKGSIMEYNKFLVNPFHSADNFEKFDRKEFVDNSLILADSGGLQQTNLKEIRHTPEEVFLWQQKYSDIGFSFDSIPFINESTSNTSKWEFDIQNFEKHAIKSKENIENCRNVHNDHKNFNFYGIIQGRKYSEFKKWKDIISSDVLDGYCVKSVSNNPLNLAESLIFAIENIDTNLHVLGIGQTSKSLLLMYISRHFHKKITFDSSSYDIGTTFRTYYSPYYRLMRFTSTETSDLLSEDNSVIIEEIEDLSKICSCPICKEIGTEISELVNSNSTSLGPMLSCHNLYEQNRILENIKLAVKNRTNLDVFVRINFNTAMANKITKALDIIDLAIEKGGEFALGKYSNLFEHNDTQVFSNLQKSIFDF